MRKDIKRIVMVFLGRKREYLIVIIIELLAYLNFGWLNKFINLKLFSLINIKSSIIPWTNNALNQT